VAHLQNRTSPRESQILQKSHQANAPRKINMGGQQHDRKEARTGNSGFAKKRVQWLIVHSTSHQLLWFVDSLVLRNPLLRKAAKRYKQC
jgi:hypothetical protein